MTNAEHKLLVAMLATHLGFTAELIETLRRNGSLSGDDLKRIWTVALSTGPEKRHLYDQVRQLYETTARAVELDLNLGEDMPAAQ